MWWSLQAWERNIPVPDLLWAPGETNPFGQQEWVRHRSRHSFCLVGNNFETQPLPHFLHLSENNLICSWRMQHSGFSPEQQQMDFKAISTITTVVQPLSCFFPFRKPVADLIQGSFSFMVFYSSGMDSCFLNSSALPSIFPSLKGPVSHCSHLPATSEHPSHTEGWGTASLVSSGSRSRFGTESFLVELKHEKPAK